MNQISSLNNQKNYFTLSDDKNFVTPQEIGM